MVENVILFNSPTQILLPFVVVVVLRGEEEEKCKDHHAIGMFRLDWKDAVFGDEIVEVSVGS